MDFKDATTEELLKEIERRKVAIEEERRPKIVFNADITPLIKLCEEYIDSIMENNHDEEYEHYIYETVLTTFYGPQVWNWINEKLNSNPYWRNS